MSPIPLGILASSGGAATAFELISTQVLTSSASSVTFSSIPATYKHLQIRAVARSTASAIAEEMYVRYNGADSEYKNHRLRGSGASVTSGVSSQFLSPLIRAATSPTNTFSPVIIDILDYANTSKNKVSRSYDAVEQENYGICFRSSLWISTSAITSINLASASNSLAAGSRFSLYGIKG